MTSHDLLTLYLEESWVNDQIINNYFTLIKTRNNPIYDFNIHVFDTFFYHFLLPMAMKEAINNRHIKAYKEYGYHILGLMQF